MTARRAYSILNIRSVDDGRRQIEGIASTPSPDRMQDIVRPLGARFQTPMPLLWQHRHDQPVGSVDFAKPNKDGIPFKASIRSLAEPGPLKDRLDEAWQSVKLKLVTAVSIGFKSLKAVPLPTGGIDFLEWAWIELSLVTCPANVEATITEIKRLDLEARRLARPGRVLRLDAADYRAAGIVRAAGQRPVQAAVMSVQDQRHGSFPECVADTVAAAARATDYELAALRRRLDELERGRT